MLLSLCVSVWQCLIVPHISNSAKKKSLKLGPKLRLKGAFGWEFPKVYPCLWRFARNILLATKIGIDKVTLPSDTLPVRDIVSNHTGKMAFLYWNGTVSISGSKLWVKGRPAWVLYSSSGTTVAQLPQGWCPSLKVLSFASHYSKL